jgi:hypothetical protein
MCMPLELFPIWIQEQYNLKMLAYKGFVHLEMRRAVWGLLQAGILANKLLRHKLAPFGYYEHVSTPGLWYHKTRPISFTLDVDNFGVKYVNKEDIDHLIASIKTNLLLPRIGRATFIAVFALIGIMKIERPTFPCLVMSKRNCKSIITL